MAQVFDTRLGAIHDELNKAHRADDRPAIEVAGEALVARFRELEAEAFTSAMQATRTVQEVVAEEKPLVRSWRSVNEDLMAMRRFGQDIMLKARNAQAVWREYKKTREM